ncbi:hypothetical protein [Flavobacterium nackdongense]|uniref:Glycosyl transferase n=1 Tax=Flavobacterium nackdongense TaxID=2547394 RepID=A0A4P6YC35_9FLAO|nr:hypothetical protein [Flavobacterium nackdongense]QBN19798.1 hypothetical protein E1750_13635 [Flavobacterium nackdongense]
MKIYLVNYATKGYKVKQRLNTVSGKIFGKFDKIFSFDPKDIDKDFALSNRNILKIEKGAGLWLWKPYFFNIVFNEKLEYGDYLFHCDSSSFFIRNVRPLIELLEQSNLDIMAFALPLTEKEWTSPKLLSYFNANEEILNSNQILANFLIVKKSKETQSFVKEWLELCSNIQLLNDNGIIDDKYPSYFKEHRYDQSILSLLCKKYSVEPFRDPSQFGIFPEMYRNNGAIIETKVLNSPYKTTIILIRKSNFFVEFFKYNAKVTLKMFFPNLYLKLLKK